MRTSVGRHPAAALVLSLSLHRGIPYPEGPARDGHAREKSRHSPAFPRFGCVQGPTQSFDTA
jgi:hypothetical protein